MRVSAIDALQRGLANVRGNWQLALIQALQGVVLGVLTLAGFVPIGLLIGLSALHQLFGGGFRWNPSATAELESQIERVVGNLPALLAAIGAAAAVWLVAYLVYCWTQAGLQSQLADGEAQAAGRERPTWRDYKVFQWGDFVRQANGRVWQFFWLIQLYVAVGMLLILVLFLAIMGAAFVGVREAAVGPALAIGCLGFCFFLLLWFLLYSWTLLGKADLVIGSRDAVRSGVWQSFKRSFGLVFRRMGAMLLYLLLVLVASIAVSMVFMPVALAADFGLGDRIGLQLAADGVVMVLQMAVSAVLATAVAAVFIALVRGERAAPVTPPEEQS